MRFGRAAASRWAHVAIRRVGAEVRHARPTASCSSDHRGTGTFGRGSVRAIVRRPNTNRERRALWLRRHRRRSWHGHDGDRADHAVPGLARAGRRVVPTSRPGRFPGHVHVSRRRRHGARHRLPGQGSGAQRAVVPRRHGDAGSGGRPLLRGRAHARRTRAPGDRDGPRRDRRRERPQRRLRAAGCEWR